MAHGIRNEQEQILSVESISQFSEEDDRPDQRERVEGWMEEGLMTKDGVLDRLTDDMLEDYLGDDAVDNLRIAFDIIKDTNSSNVAEEVTSKSKFVSFLSDRFPGFESDVQARLSVVYDIVLHFGSFPFQAPSTSTNGMTYPAFLRAIAFLSQKYTLCSGEAQRSSKLGPWNGMAILNRKRTSSDTRRALFRSLARPIPPSQNQDQDLLRTKIQSLPKELRDQIHTSYLQHIQTKILIPYFLHCTFDETIDKEQDNEAYWETCKETVIVDYEDEREVDILDVLIEAFPGKAINVGAPYRESLRMSGVLNTLELPKWSLGELRVSRARLKDLVFALGIVHFAGWGVEGVFGNRGHDDLDELREVVDCICNSFTGEGESIFWEAFDFVFQTSLPRLFDGLTNLMSIFFELDHTFLQECDILLPPHHAGGILTKPLLFQINTFLPEWLDPEPLKLLLAEPHTRPSIIGDLATSLAPRSGSFSSLLLISGSSINPVTSTTAQQKVVLGSLIRGFCRGTIDPTIVGEGAEEVSEVVLFQLGPVHRVYRLRPSQLPSGPILHHEGIMIGCLPEEENFGVEMGRTRLWLRKELDEVIFEHGKKDGCEGVFEGFSGFGVGGEGVMKMNVEKLEVWGI